MSDHPTKEQFLANVATHELTVSIDSDTHRHLTFKRPESSTYYFHIVTWPGYLAISGDMGCFVFARLRDMFEFFRGDEINRSYWAEKLQAHDARSGHMAFSPDLYREAITRHFQQWTFECDEDRERAWKEIENEWDGLLGAMPSTAHEAISRAMDYECMVSKNRFTDFWDNRVEDYSFHFVWCCYAIQWAISQYDELKAATAEPAAVLA